MCPLIPHPRGEPHIASHRSTPSALPPIARIALSPCNARPALPAMPATPRIATHHIAPQRPCNVIVATVAWQWMAMRAPTRSAPTIMARHGGRRCMRCRTLPRSAITTCVSIIDSGHNRVQKYVGHCVPCVNTRKRMARRGRNLCVYENTYLCRSCSNPPVSWRLQCLAHLNAR